jgi:hypothetical protein
MRPQLFSGGLTSFSATDKNIPGVVQQIAMPGIEVYEQRLRSCEREIRNLVEMAADPSQPPDQLELIRDLTRSAQAELRLRELVLAWARGDAA